MADRIIRKASRFIFGLTSLFILSGSAAAGDLAKLRSLKVSVGTISPEARSLGVAEDDLEAHVVVFLRSKIPGLQVSTSAPEYIVVNVALDYIEQSGRKMGYAGAITVLVYRLATVVDTKKVSLVGVWADGTTLAGGRDATIRVREMLDRLLTRFAADWYKDNP